MMVSTAVHWADGVATLMWFVGWSPAYLRPQPRPACRRRRASRSSPAQPAPRGRLRHEISAARWRSGCVVDVQCGAVGGHRVCAVRAHRGAATSARSWSFSGGSRSGLATFDDGHCDGNRCRLFRCSRGSVTKSTAALPTGCALRSRLTACAAALVEHGKRFSSAPDAPDGHRTQGRAASVLPPPTLQAGSRHSSPCRWGAARTAALAACGVSASGPCVVSGPGALVRCLRVARTRNASSPSCVTSTLWSSVSALDGAPWPQLEHHPHRRAPHHATPHSSPAMIVTTFANGGAQPCGRPLVSQPTSNDSLSRAVSRRTTPVLPNWSHLDPAQRTDVDVDVLPPRSSVPQRASALPRAC